MGDDAPTAEDDQNTLIDLDSIFNKKEFWADMSNLDKDKEAQNHLEECATKALRKVGVVAPDETRIKTTSRQIRSKWDNCRKHVCVQVRKGLTAAQLCGNVEEYAIDQSSTSVSTWLLTFLRGKNAIPQCILDAIQEPNDDDHLIVDGNPHQSVLNLLKEIRGEDPKGFRGLKYTSDIIHQNETEFAHFIGNPNFRHAGKTDLIPKQVFIQAPTPTGTHQDERVHVYHEESGSGKTVQLAASAYTRGALFTIMLNTDDVKLLPSSNADEVDKDDRMNKSWTKLTDEVGSILTRDKNSLDRLVDFLEKLDKVVEEKTTLFIVVGIDEASKSPNFVRAIIQSHSDFGTDLGKFIQRKCTEEVAKQANSAPAGETQDSSNANGQDLCVLNHIDIKVLFSVAGTGAGQTPAGSIPKNFTHLHISAKLNPADVYHILRSEYVKDVKDGTNTIIPEYTEVKKFPLLKAIVDSNARMISIYMRVSNNRQKSNQRTGKKSSENEYEQNAILSETFTAFMKSNGLITLVHNPYLARLTASQALAVLLFQQNKPFRNPLTNDQLNNMDYGITFQRFKDDVDADADTDASDAIMRRLVVTYGLVTARPLKGKGNCTPQAKPFALSDAMQLLCLWLIQGGEAVAAEKSFLGTTSTSFETLTALLAGAAIAASSVVKKDGDGRVIAAPANGPNPNTVGQQKADIFAALGKVGMSITPHLTNNRFSHYTCETTDGDKCVEKNAGHQFSALKNTHPALLPDNLEIPRVYFHKSMMTSVESGVDKRRIRAATRTKFEDAISTAHMEAAYRVSTVSEQLHQVINGTPSDQRTIAIGDAAQLMEDIKTTTAHALACITGTAAQDQANTNAVALPGLVATNAVAVLGLAAANAATAAAALGLAATNAATAAAAAALDRAAKNAAAAAAAQGRAAKNAAAQGRVAKNAAVQGQAAALAQGLAAVMAAAAQGLAATKAAAAQGLATKSVAAALGQAVTNAAAAALGQAVTDAAALGQAVTDAAEAQGLAVTNATAALGQAATNAAAAKSLAATNANDAMVLLDQAAQGAAVEAADDALVQAAKAAAAADAQDLSAKAAAAADAAQDLRARNASAAEHLKAAKAATADAAGAIFRGMDVEHMQAKGISASSPLMNMTEHEITAWLEDHHSIFIDRDLLRQLKVLWDAVGQSNSGQHNGQQDSGQQDNYQEDANPAAAPAPANASHSTTTVKYFFNLPLIHVAEGSSEFADAYVTFLTEKMDTTTGKKIYGLRTICIQAKDYAKDTSPKMETYKKNASAVANPALDPLFGDDRIYTAAGTRNAVAWNCREEFPYVPFVVDDSKILENQMEAMSKRRSKTAKHGAHAVLCIGPSKIAPSSTQGANKRPDAQPVLPGETKKRSIERGQDASSDSQPAAKKQRQSA